MSKRTEDAKAIKEKAIQAKKDAYKARKHKKDKWWLLDQKTGKIARCEEPKGEDRKSRLRVRASDDTSALEKILTRGPFPTPVTEEASKSTEPTSAPTDVTPVPETGVTPETAPDTEDTAKA